MALRLNIVVEGRTEEGFVKRVLAPYLGTHGIFCMPRCIATRRDRRKHFVYRGGHTEYFHLKEDLIRWMKEDANPDTCFSTMIDLYALPSSFPGFGESRSIKNPFERVAFLDTALAKDVKETIYHPRFIPYIQLHEFEALLFCDCSHLPRRYPNRKMEASSLGEMCRTFESPDWIDDGERTAPSKRIIEKIPEYENEKAFAGPLITEWIGLAGLRKCRHFSDWLDHLSRLRL